MIYIILALALLCVALGTVALERHEQSKSRDNLAAYWRNLYMDRAESAGKWMNRAIEYRDRVADLSEELEAYRSEETKP